MAQAAQKWEQQLAQAGRVEIGVPPAKAVWTVLMSVLLLGLGVVALLAPLLVDTMDDWRLYVLPVAGVILILCVPLALSQLSGWWNLVVTPQSVGYRDLQIPWNEVEVVGELTQRVQNTRQKHAAIFLTPQGEDRLLTEGNGLRRTMHKVSSASAKAPAIFPAKMLEGSREEKIHWLASVHARALGYPG